MLISSRKIQTTVFICSVCGKESVKEEDIHSCETEHRAKDCTHEWKCKFSKVRQSCGSEYVICRYCPKCKKVEEIAQIDITDVKLKYLGEGKFDMSIPIDYVRVLQ